MKKKKGGGGGANWMDTYGDMVTLLLCFFVLLYSMSTIDTDKWRAIVMSFNPLAVQTPTDPNGNSGDFADPDIGHEDPGVLDPSEVPEPEDIDAAIAAILAQFQQMAQDAESDASTNVTVQKLDDGRIYVAINDTAFFNADSAELRKDSYPVLDRICTILSDAEAYISEVEIQGHTARARGNEIPNEEVSDRTISSNRANNVLLYIQQHSALGGDRLKSVGMGEWHPVATNATAEGRAQNRRVEFYITGRDLADILGENIPNYETN